MRRLDGRIVGKASNGGPEVIRERLLGYGGGSSSVAAILLAFRILGFSLKIQNVCNTREILEFQDSFVFLPQEYRIYRIFRMMPVNFPDLDEFSSRTNYVSPMTKVCIIILQRVIFPMSYRSCIRNDIGEGLGWERCQTGCACVISLDGK